ncbi:hypothetical protein HZH66_006806 [Vespula vulgaris]|uniref:Uncharacterized protein n=1 Tax=Vespula vulgaris TaxID=7454 RepID=A0A834K5V1_VESVU|nr:hypothetical protein HZH66_006806 [Vespula vulgaris]
MMTTATNEFESPCECERPCKSGVPARGKSDFLLARCDKNARSQIRMRYCWNSESKMLFKDSTKYRLKEGVYDWKLCKKFDRLAGRKPQRSVLVGFPRVATVEFGKRTTMKMERNFTTWTDTYRRDRVLPSAG